MRVEKVPTQYAHPPCKARKKFQRNLKFPLDKPHTMWYNVREVKREQKFFGGGVAQLKLIVFRTAIKPRKKVEKSSKNLLTDPTKCGIIQVFQGNEIKNLFKEFDTMSNTTNSSVRKPTKRQMFEGLLKMPGLTDAQVEFINHEIDLLTKKNAGDKKPTATQIANEALKVAIAEGMEQNRMYSCTEVIKEIPACAGLNPQKISPLMNQMAEAGILTKTVEKRRSYFALAK